MQNISKLLNQIKLRLFAILIVFCLLGLSYSALYAQTATVTAVSDSTCIGDRIGRKGICTANEFTSVLTFSQSTTNTLTTCLAGTDVLVDVIADISGTNTDRYDVAYFFGQAGNLPENTSGTCSVGTFPSSPAPFADLDNAFVGAQDTCGDFVGGGVASLEIKSVKLRCQPAAGSGGLNVPYSIAWNAQQPYACNAANIKPVPDSKCLSGPVASILVGATVQGWVRIIKQTTPDGDPENFQFTASSPSGASPSVSSFTLSDNQSQLVSIPLAATTRTISVTESLAAGWEPGAVITCVRPDGSAAPFVTVNNATRTINANLLGLNNTAVCTFTNTKKPTVTLRKTWVNATLNDVVTVAATGLTSLTAVANTANETDTGAAQPANVGSVLTLSETYNTGLAVNYTSSLTCSGTAGWSGSTLTVGATDTAIVCTYTNTRNVANLVLTKTDAKTTTVAGDTNTYTITLTNNGPAAANGALVVDSATSGLTCTALNCSPAAGASCPTTLSVAAFQSSGLSIPFLPSGGSVTFTLTCTVTATGV
jgi:uncharacterized repeat protein (TIGR01451 family)